ncbi:MAG: hypothetical protein D6715_13845 [Calditrichaeota bacterium]|nr:MAG: hypothetical protein D6715_13845 [Calditrichota bacterium]
MIEQHFPQLVGRKGVSAVMLCDTRGGVRGYWVKPKMNNEVLGEICEQFVHVFSLANQLGYEIEELVVPFEKGLIYARPAEKFILGVVARLNLDVSLLRLIVNVHLADFLQDKKVQRMLKKWPEWSPANSSPIKLDEIEVQLIQRMTEASRG